MPDLPAVQRRLVVFLPGFEAIPAAAHGRRFVREAKAHGADLPHVAPTRHPGRAGGRFDGWFESPPKAQPASRETELHIDSLDAIAAAYACRRPPLRPHRVGLIARCSTSPSPGRVALRAHELALCHLLPLSRSYCPLLPLLLAWSAWNASGGTAFGLAAGGLAAGGNRVGRPEAPAPDAGHG